MKTMNSAGLSWGQSIFRRLTVGLTAAFLLTGCCSASLPVTPASSYAEAVVRLQNEFQIQSRGRLIELSRCRFRMDGLKTSESFNAGDLLPESDATVPNLLFWCKGGTDCVAFTFKSNQFTVVMPWIDFGNWPDEDAAGKKAAGRLLTDLITMCHG